MEQLLKLAINRHIIGKIECDSEQNQEPDPRWEIFTSMCENVEVTPAEFADYINKGYAFCAQHKKRKRNANFTGTNILTVDIDKGMTTEHALADPFVQRYGTILYVTASHTPERHRFRIIFALERTITDAEEMRMAYQGIIRKFGGDESCSDACRGFFGSLGCNPILLGNALPNEELSKIITRGADRRVSDRVCGDKGGEIGGKATQTSHEPLEKNQMVRLAREGGRMTPLAGLPKWTAIHCPMHTDHRPSAFVVTNKNGVNGVRCQSCAASFWPETEIREKRKPYNFYEIESFIYDEDYHQTPANFYDMDAADADPTLLDELPGERTSHILNSKYLPSIPLQDGVTFVRSPKGSGKTEWLKKIVDRCRQLNQSVLLIGHRQTLIQGIAQRLGLICYFYIEGDRIKNNRSEEYYAICVDSIGKLLRPNLDHYDIVIIDESEQVFSHLTADTLRSKRRTCYQKLIYFLRSAKSIIVTDADLGPITVVAVCEAVKRETPYQFYLNRYKESRCAFYYFQSDDHLIHDMIEAIRAGGRHYVATNSKIKAENLLEMIRYEFGDHRRTMLVTSDTTGDANVKNFVNNIKKEILNYDVIIASPTLGTGVDITFDDQAQLIDTVYGFFVARVNTHFDIDQQLARVRHPKLIKAWVAPERFGFETEAEVIRSEILDSAALNDVLIGYENDGTPKMDEGYLSVYASVTAMSRASKNNLRANLLNLRIRNGWTVEHVAADEQSAKNGQQRTKEAKAVLAEERMRQICQAEQITPEAYEELRAIAQQGTKLTKSEEYSMRRQEIESFYREEISPELIDLDNHGKYREQVRMMQIYLSPWQDLAERSVAERRADRFLTDMGSEPLKKAMMFDLLAAAGLADESTPIKTGVVVSKHSLAAFAEICQARSSKIQELFGLNVRTKDLHSKAVQKLSKVLELIGLNNLPAVRRKAEGDSTHYYTLDTSSLDQIRSIIAKRVGTSTNAAPILTDTRYPKVRELKRMWGKRKTEKEGVRN
ncbi:plasmid replication protein, CyRepA1 family [Massilia sp. ST3]|uniref:plasmid replication protein, CyRepA1 family n=1 Tax=Massilia sp. ST3 TaxID=2824903 RepID=UPI001B82B31C|nr:plasmid replication protein, CyRepA1 family [Massilia sp. ST3]MBQ5946298.1 hypothetical protein [Massilia sp. ST3]